jgi:hypothetical protein
MRNVIILLTWVAAIIGDFESRAQNDVESIPLENPGLLDSLIVEDVVTSDSLLEKVITRKNDKSILKRLSSDYPKPRTAAIVGLIIPGGGQMYNQDWWKVPISWAAYGGVVYVIRQNTLEYRSFRDAVTTRLNQQPDPYPQFSLPGLRRQRDFYRKNMERAYIGLVAVHVLSALEAFVACHLNLFDISDQLSMGAGAPIIYPHQQSFPSTTIIYFTYSLK